MKIAQLVEEERKIHSPNTNVSKLRRKFENGDLKSVLVETDNTIRGAVTHRELVQSRINGNQKIGSLMQPVPRLSDQENIRDTARALVESNTAVAPVYAGEQFTGVVSRDAVLGAVLTNLDALTVADICTRSVVSLPVSATVGEAVSALKRHDISRVPVVTETGSLSGIVTTSDIIGVVVRDENAPTDGSRGGEAETVREMSVTVPMSSPVETVSADASLMTAVETMLDKRYNGLIVTDEDTVTGVITKTDALRALSYKENDTIPVQITNTDLLGRYSRVHVRESVQEIIDMYQQLRVQHVHTRLHQHSEQRRDQSLIRCEVRLQTNHGQIAGTGEEFGADSAFDSALGVLERNVIETKERNAP